MTDQILELTDVTAGYGDVQVLWGVSFKVREAEIATLVGANGAGKSTTVHMLTAGTDVKALIASSATVLLGVAVTFGAVAMYLWRTSPNEPRALASTARVPHPNI